MSALCKATLWTIEENLAFECDSSDNARSAVLSRNKRHAIFILNSKEYCKETKKGIIQPRKKRWR